MGTVDRASALRADEARKDRMTMRTKRMFRTMRAWAGLLLMSMIGLGAQRAQGEPLKIAYSDWPGWIAWDIAIQKDWFKEAGVEVKFEWFDYVASMDAYSAGQVDAVCMTNGDAMVTGATGKASKGIVINDYSNGNDMVVAKPGIGSLADLKGKKVGVEVGFIPHLLLLSGLEKSGLTEADVTLVNTPTNETPQVLASGQVDAIVAWQPNSGQALKLVPGSKPVFTSANVPGLIYDMLCVSNESLATRRADWLKVTQVWFRIADYMADPANKEEMLKILSARAGITPAEYEPFLAGTHIMGLKENLKVFEEAAGLESVYGSNVTANDFNVKNKVYEKSQDVKGYLLPDLVKAVAELKSGM
jgi:NitT/TauT family transport system substrate-binding protein